MKKYIPLCVLAICLMALLGSKAVKSDEPDFLAFSTGWFDFNRQKDQGGEFRLEYKSDYKFLNFKPFTSLAAVSNGMTFLGAGILMDVYFGRRLVVTPSFAPTWWRGKTTDLDLGHRIEFRSQLEFAYRFDDRSRLGVSISHYSNAGLGDDNPGAESFMVNYSVPISKLFKNL